MERSNNILLGDNVAASLSNEEFAKRLEKMKDDEINDEDFKNVNNFLFNPAELMEREKLRFEEVNKNYREKKDLKNLITEVKKKRPLYESLPPNLQGFFLTEAKKQRKIDYHESDEEVNKVSTDDILNEYANDTKKARILMTQALQEAEKICNEFIDSREDLAYLGYFRKKVPYHGHSSEYWTLNEETEEEGKYTTMNLFMCVKYKNSGKLSSHNWFFNGFCKELEPKYAVLLDVGLKPKGDALMKMYNYLKKHDSDVGGVCGYMSLKI